MIKKGLVAFLLVGILSFGMVFVAEAEENEYETLQIETEETETISISDIVGDGDIELDNDELFSQYVDNAFHSGGVSLFSLNEGDYLTGKDKILYDKMYEFIVSAAKGEQAESVLNVPMYELLGKECSEGYFKLTSEELGLDYIHEDGKANSNLNKALNNMFKCDTATVLYSLMADWPYELYWYDKATGLSQVNKNVGDASSLKISSADPNCIFVPESYCKQITFYVSADYSLTGESGTTAFNQEQMKSVSVAVENAKKVVEQAAGLNDYEKLDYYRGWICANVKYNFDALADDTPYGDPWQVIYVFDEDSSTNVVCEGYAKAFQYLCDNTAFDSEDIYCICAEGNVASSSTSGPHMWNIVHMDDEYNYLVDLTWSDDSYYGDRQFFMLGAYSIYENSGYVFDNIIRVTYTYDMRQMMAVYPEEALQIRLGTSYYENECRVEELALNVEDGYIGLVIRAVLPVQVFDQYGHLMNSSRIIIRNTATTESSIISTSDRSRCRKVDGSFLNVYDIWIPVNAKEMSDTYEISVFDNDNNEHIFSNKNSNEYGHYLCSVMAYIEEVLKDSWSTGNEQETALIKSYAYDMKTYGLCAQDYFGYDSSINMEQLVEAEYGTVEENCYVLPEGMSCIGSSLLMEEYVTVRTYFALDDDMYNQYTMVFVDTNANENYQLEKIASGIYYMDYPITDMSKLYTVHSLEFGVGDGCYVDFNVANYCLLARENGSSKLNNLLNSLYLYYSAYGRLVDYYVGD